MKTSLKKIASVQMGYSFRTRLDSMPTGAIAVIQMKDLTAENRVDCSELTRIDMENVREHHLVKQGDLIFRSRGQVATSAILLDDPGDAVVAAPLLRIRVTDNCILPEYLNWFISQKSAQAFFTSRAKGTFQKMISKQALESLEVLVSPLTQQKTIVELVALSGEEQILMERLAGKRQQYISTILMQLAKGE